jgi:2-aminoadipate transaminase
MERAENSFAYCNLLAAPAPQPEERFAGYPRYNFVGGHNDPARIPIEQLATAATSVLNREGQSLAMYNLGRGSLGYPGLREFVAKKLNKRMQGVLSADDILITSGSSQGLDLVNRLFVSPGDTVLIEEFSYQGAFNKARSLGAKIVGIPLDREGIRIDRLEEILRDLSARGVTPKYIYTIPTVQNPTGTVLSLERRVRLIELSKQFGVPIFEDECYTDLVWNLNPPPTLYGLAPSQVVHIGSFSKSLAPALRIGYAVAGWEILGRLLSMKSDGGTGALDQMIVAEFLTKHFDDHMATMTGSLQRKLEVLTEAVAREFGTTVEIWHPEGGIFAWLQFPDHIDVRTFAAEALAAGVAFNAGPDWSWSTEHGQNFMRLCFALPDEQTIDEGVAELARVCFERTGMPVHGSNQRRQQTAGRKQK